MSNKIDAPRIHLSDKSDKTQTGASLYCTACLLLDKQLPLSGKRRQNMPKPKFLS